MLKYSLKNLKYKICDKPVSFIMSETYIFMCILALFFCYGVAGNFYLMNRDRDADVGERAMLFHFDTENGDVTLQEVYNFIADMDSGQIVDINYANAVVEGNGECFGISENGIKYYSEEGINYRKNGWLIKGRFYSEDEFNRGDKVIVIPDVEKYGNMYSYDKKTETAIYNGEKYKVIGMVDMGQGVSIPITAYSGDSVVNELYIEFNRVMTKTSYNSMIANAHNAFNNKFRVNEMKFDNAEQKRFYRKMFIQETLIIIVVVINLILIFIHMAKKHKIKNNTYFICGMSRQKIINTVLLEWTFMIAPVYIMAVLIFDLKLKKILSTIYPYITECIDLTVYRIITCIFVFVLALMDTVAVNSQVRIKDGVFR
ncbi:MAG: hypothetical protein NC393_07160 [Clostridium sp.]|nr:hypothetical protein [Clostridium sp.]MCM1171890.1 hypothetical protein [Clostridium sp.]MCM1209784.1 hypothetical protein [Ruminococcus sp.]